MRICLTCSPRPVLWQSRPHSGLHDNAAVQKWKRGRWSEFMQHWSRSLTACCVIFVWKMKRLAAVQQQSLLMPRRLRVKVEEHMIARCHKHLDESDKWYETCFVKGMTIAGEVTQQRQQRVPCLSGLTLYETFIWVMWLLYTSGGQKISGTLCNNSAVLICIVLFHTAMPFLTTHTAFLLFTTKTIHCQSCTAESLRPVWFKLRGKNLGGEHNETTLQHYWKKKCPVLFYTRWQQSRVRSSDGF